MLPVVSSSLNASYITGTQRPTVDLTHSCTQEYISFNQATLHQILILSGYNTYWLNGEVMFCAYIGAWATSMVSAVVSAVIRSGAAKAMVL